ncbi:hypothetical protein AB6A40_002344 [Gnathostoma spinigerum]|uniref:Succinate dehydrogenase assembly factor 2, mitochondrial n=1 Tax=Gnathostoma spinigerum TaxID=75299 RepID=A0ABD6E6B3_9BILA
MNRLLVRNSGRGFLKLLRPSVLSVRPFCGTVEMPRRANEDIKTLRSRLVYQSKKRGILENDILIGDFADLYLNKMGREELDEYDEIINGKHMEWDLYYYISGKKAPPKDLENSKVFKMMKDYVNEVKDKKPQ